MTVELSHVVQRIHRKTVLEDINICFDSQYIYGLQGKNGSGKIMLLRVISGLIVPDSGTVTIDGKQLHKQLSFPESIGVLIESPAFLNEMTGLQNLHLLSSINGAPNRDALCRTLEKVGLDPADRRTYKKYSLGMKQRLGIAAAIMGTPQIVLLDEPTNAIDRNGIRLVHNCLLELKQKGSLVVMACHDTNELQSLADVVVEMEEGRICQIQKNSA